MLDPLPSIALVATSAFLAVVIAAADAPTSWPGQVVRAAVRFLSLGLFALALALPLLAVDARHGPPALLRLALVAGIAPALYFRAWPWLARAVAASQAK